jgi:uncharacterized membrane protein YhaH (DUF805 family)
MFIPSPIRLGHTSVPFDREDWLFELIYDGFRALSVIENGQCRFLSRNLNPLRGLDRLADALVKEVKVDRAILDGELAVIDENGRSVFKAMIFERQQARYCAFDVLSVYGHDLTGLPLLKRKEKLRQILPQRSVLFLFTLPWATILTVKRLHDFGWSGWMFLVILMARYALGLLTSNLQTGYQVDILLAPVDLAIIMAMAISLWPGTAGSNRFGSP